MTFTICIKATAMSPQKLQKLIHILALDIPQ